MFIGATKFFSQPAIRKMNRNHPRIQNLLQTKLTEERNDGFCLTKSFCCSNKQELFVHLDWY
jgi:hypothetical protein